MKRPLVSIIVVSYNTLKFTKMCVESILKYTKVPFELIVVDNASSDGTQQWLKFLKKKNRNIKIILNKENLGVAGGWNKGIRIAKGNYIVVMNNDVVVFNNWMDGLIRCAEKEKEIGIVGCVTALVRNDRGLFPKFKGLRNIKELQRTAAVVSLLNKDKYEEIPFVHGMCMFIKREVIDKIGLFDERFYPYAGEDIDYSIRAKLAGFKLVAAKDVFIFHFESRSARNMFDLKKYEVFTKNRIINKWGEVGRKFYKELDIYRMKIRNAIKKNFNSGSTYTNI